MKTKNFNTHIRIFGFALILFTAGFTGCKKEENETAITEDEAADAIEYALTGSSQGMTAQFDDALEMLDEVDGGKTSGYDIACGVAFDSTVTRSGSILLISYNYVFNWNYILNCNLLNVPQDFVFNYSATGSYDADKMSSNDAATGALTIKGLQPTADFYLFNGTYSRTGSLESKTGRQSKFTSTISFALTDINVNKTTKKAASGTTDVTITGLTSGGDSFTLTGQVTFNVNGNATIVINGKTYIIQL